MKYSVCRNKIRPMRVSHSDMVLIFCYHNHDIFVDISHKDDNPPTIFNASAAGPDVIVGIRSLRCYS